MVVAMGGDLKRTPMGTISMQMSRTLLRDHQFGSFAVISGKQVVMTTQLSMKLLAELDCERSAAFD